MYLYDIPGPVWAAGRDLGAMVGGCVQMNRMPSLEPGKGVSKWYIL